VKLLLALSAAVVFGSTAVATNWDLFKTDGVRIQHPADWYATADPPTPVTYPKQVLVATSFPLPKNAVANGCRPTGLLARKQPDGAVIFVIEYGDPGAWKWPKGYAPFPVRPRHFTLQTFANYECYGRSFQLRFRDAGRYFQVFTSFGRRATPATRATALHVLNSFRATPR